MSVKVSQLSGPALDWSVGIAEEIPSMHLVDKPGKICVYGEVNGINFPFQPSTDWSQGGQIIERERINIEGKVGWSPGSNAFGPYFKAWQGLHHDDPDVSEYGPTPLIAALRCYVASKLGTEITVPKELQ